MLSKIFKLIFKRKLITSMSFIVIIIGGYFGYQGLVTGNSETQYVTAAVERGTIISSISGTGQVSASNQIEIKSKVSGDVVYLGVQKGQEINSEALLFQIDSRDAQNDVRDAETDLETAQLELEELLQPVYKLDLLKSENNLTQARESKQKAENNILEGYEDALNDIADSFLDLPTVIIRVEDILYSKGISDSESFSQDFSNLSVLENFTDQGNRSKLNLFIDSVKDDYRVAREKYDQNFENYKDASRYSSQEITEALLEETVETTRAISETIKSETNLLDYWVDCRSQSDLFIYSQVTEYQQNLASYTATVNSHLSTLLAIERSLENNREVVLDAERSIEELEMELIELKEGVDSLDIRVKEIVIQQKKDALLEAQQNLADHYIRAPFSGMVAEVDINNGESVSSGGVVATFITKQKIAEITLNEIDMVQIKTGQKTTIIFDAIEDLNITGEVVEMDIIGTVNQGVVDYGVKIGFDTQDKRVRPGMSVSANIITDAKQNVLMAPNSVVKEQNDIYYLEVMDNNIPRIQQVTVGISNDTHTEITGGLNEGDKIITQTIESKEGSQSLNSGQTGGDNNEMRQMMKVMR